MDAHNRCKGELCFVLFSCDCALPFNRPHIDTPRGMIQFRFAVTGLQTAHVAGNDVSFEDAIKNLNSFGLCCTEEETSKSQIRIYCCFDLFVVELLQSNQFFCDYKELTANFAGEVIVFYSN